ncbi:MAG: acyltransferase [Methylophilaceae bacterium]|nr:acyltransferase [Methylophilaceae bacterium]
MNTIDKPTDLLNPQVINESNHYRWLDQVRGAAALYVVCHHAVRKVVVLGDHAHDPFYRLLQLLTTYDHYAVDIFIVLSGYCLMLPLIRKQHFGSILNFYIRRTIRIVLPYYGALFVTLILIYFSMGEMHGSVWAKNALPVTFESFWKHLLLIHQWFPTVATKINGAFWSIGVEYQIYFLFPLFYFLAKKNGFVNTFFLISIVSYALWGISFNFNVINPGENGTSIYYCSLFFMGVVAAQYANQEDQTQLILFIDKHSKIVKLTAFAGIGLLAIASFSISHFHFSFSIPLQIQSFFVGFFVAVLFYLKGKNKIQLNCFNNLVTKPLELVGTIGFSIYLLHDPVLEMVWFYVVAPMNLPFYWLQAIVEIVLGLIASFSLAIIFYKFIEFPCHLLSKSFKNEKSTEDFSKKVISKKSATIVL